MVLVVAAADAAAAQAPAVDPFLDKVSDYVAAYERTFVGVVAEETYRQEVKPARAGTDARGFPIESRSQRRDLKSDVLLVRAPAGDRWMQFRDVYEVDGKAVRDRPERLAKLFLQPSADARRQVDEITAASARYNIGSVNRNINLPVLALTVLEPENRPWFAFRVGRASAATTALEYREERSGTLIRTAGDQPMPAHGRVTFETPTGRVLATTLAAEDASLRAQIDVTYGSDAAVDLFVPREMREKYVTKDGSTTEGRATYANFRRYQVRVEEKIGRAAAPRYRILLARANAADTVPTLETVLQRAAEYVTAFHRKLSRIVAEERYTQRSETIWSGKRSGTTKRAERVLLSDLLLVKPAGADDWLQYRDVFEVDGERVRDRAERLPDLLADRSLSAAAQVERIRRESARYNLGSIERDVNVPVLAMRFLSPENQPRFAFKRAADRSTAAASIAPDVAGAFRVTAEVWAVDYEEVRKPTLIRTLRNKDLPAHGRFWIEPDTGRVLLTELRAGDKSVRGTIDVSYQSEPLMGLLVPIEMREEYFDRSGAHITGVATYGRFRPLRDE